MKQPSLRDMFLKPSKHVCTSTVVVSPDPLSPIITSSLDMKSPENTVSWQQHIYCAIIKYMGFLQDAVYQDPAYLYNCLTKKCLHFNCLTFTSCHLCTKVANLVLCNIALVVHCGSKYVGMFSVML